MKTVQSINPGQPELPDWVYNGAILGVQGGTERMLDILQQVSDYMYSFQLFYFNNIFIDSIPGPRERSRSERVMDSGLVWKDCHRFWNKSVLELAMERYVVSQS